MAGRALLIEGPPRSGKSSLALALIYRGAMLIGDDEVMLEVLVGQLLAHPHPETRGLLAFASCESAPIALVLILDREAPRFVESAKMVQRAGIALPSLRLWPDSPVLATKAELALQKFGLA